MTRIWAHRGASGYYPENTLPAFQGAVDMKADGIELDIQLTKDGEIVVCHDELLDRTSSGEGLLCEKTLAELKELDFSYDHPECGHVQIPTMREVFELIRPTGLTVNIELKTGVLDYEGIEEKILALSEEMGMKDRVIYSSFNHYSILRIQKLDPSARTAFLYMDGPIDMPLYCAKYHVDAIHPWVFNLRYPDFLKQCRENNLEINVWTVNRDDFAARCFAMDVDSIITNYPDRMRKLMEEYGNQ